jgi:hypothetical protein
MRLKVYLFKFAFFITLIYGQILLAQDAHYWTNQYGTRADLLGGLVVGSIKDLSSTYYNPGAIAFSTDQSLVLTTDAVEISTIKLKNVAGRGFDLSSTQSGAAPSIFAVRLTFEKLRKNHLAFFYLTRHDFKFDAVGRRIDTRGPYLFDPFQEYFTGEVNYVQNLFESWGGLTWSRRVGEKAGIGISQIIAYRSQRGRFQTIAQLVSGEGDGSALILADAYKYYNLRTLWKIGFTFDYRPISFGFTFTTPSLNIFGDGSTFINVGGIEIDTSGSGSSYTSLASNYQEKLAAYYRSPLSIAVGAAYRFHHTSLYFTLEWFNSVSRFKVLETENFIAQTSGELWKTDFSHELKSIINFGFGVQHEFHKKLSIYGSVFTDRSAKIPGSDTRFSISNWDIIHITTGSSLTFWRLDLTLGITIGFGKEYFEQVVDFGKLETVDDFLPVNGDSEVLYRRIKFIIGFSFMY